MNCLQFFAGLPHPIQKSADTFKFVLAVGSYSARIEDVVNLSLIFANASV